MKKAHCQHEDRTYFSISGLLWSKSLNNILFGDVVLKTKSVFLRLIWSFAIN